VQLFCEANTIIYVQIPILFIHTQGFFSWLCEAALAPSLCEKMSRKLFKIVNGWVANFSKLWKIESRTIQNCEKLSRKLLKIVKNQVVKLLKLWKTANFVKIHGHVRFVNVPIKLVKCPSIATRKEGKKDLILMPSCSWIRIWHQSTACV